MKSEILSWNALFSRLSLLLRDSSCFFSFATSASVAPPPCPWLLRASLSDATSAMRPFTWSLLAFCSGLLAR